MNHPNRHGILKKLSLPTAMLGLMGWMVLVSACMPYDYRASSASAELSTWEYTDLRVLDPIDARHPEQDLIAAYWRCLPAELTLPRKLPNNPHCASGNIQVRLDFLSPSILPAYDLYLILDHQVGGSRVLPGGIQTDLAWDTLIKIDAYGDHQVYDARLNPGAALALRVLRDNSAKITFTFNIQELSFSLPSLGWQIFILPPGEPGSILDQTKPLLANGTAPDRVPLLLVFTQSFTADTPALTLRRWDGAHTGPLGGRHGLYNLLRTARAYQIPLTLLDIKEPDSLAALDYGQALPLIKDMAAAGLLDMPELALEHKRSMTESYMFSSTRPFSLAFGLPTSSFLWAPDAPQASFPNSYAKFIHFTSPFSTRGITVLRDGQRDILLPAGLLLPETEPQAVMGGLDSSAIETLIPLALDSDGTGLPQGEFVVLGGRLPTSTWGVPDYARAVFSYIRNHPWIQPIKLSQIQSFPTYEAKVNVAEIPFDAASEPASINWSGVLSLDQLPAQIRFITNELTRLYSCSSPYKIFSETDPSEHASRQIWQVISPALVDWLVNPHAFASLLDNSAAGRNLYLLGSQHYFAVIDLRSSALLSLYFLETGSLHQLIGPPLCAPSGNASPGAATVPGQTALPGWVNWTPGQEYSLESINPYTVRLKSPSAVVVYQLDDSGLYIGWDPSPSQGTALRLVPDPWNAYKPGWADRYKIDQQDPDSLRITTGNLEMNLASDVQVEYHSFLESQNLMGSIENPNLDLPPGHYLPFSTLEVIIPSGSQYSLHLHAIGLP